MLTQPRERDGSVGLYRHAPFPYLQPTEAQVDLRVKWVARVAPACFDSAPSVRCVRPVTHLKLGGDSSEPLDALQRRNRDRDVQTRTQPHNPYLVWIDLNWIIVNSHVQRAYEGKDVGVVTRIAIEPASAHSERLLIHPSRG